MDIAVLFNAVGADAPPDERDVIAQLELVVGALANLGQRAYPVPVDLDLASLRARLRERPPDMAFNLVEALEGSERMILTIPGLLESLGVAYTGATLASLAMCADKVIAKRLLLAAGIPTPRWSEDLALTEELTGAERIIVKSRWSHGSVGLEADRVVSPAGLAALRALPGNATRDLFAEEFVAGREFNLSVLGGAAGAEVLPPAEIRFEGFGDAPRIVGYRAKWEPDSPEYRGTPRSFEFDAGDDELLSTLRALAVRAFECFRLRGSARVDFRVDGEGRPFVLEVNANPCLSPDAGFMAAAERAGLSVDTVVSRILEDASEGARNQA